ncbi:MAG: UDP-2,3-diacylglucosamine diphosphatase LpxI domain-containing protein [Candidatus Rokuibacteriota bacterium]
MCGAGPLPARMAQAARRRGWRVVAFAFPGAEGMGPHADRVVPSRITEAAAVLATLQAEGATAALFGGRFSMSDVLRADAASADLASQRIGEQAGSRADAKLLEAVVAQLASIGVEVLDQRPFVGDLAAAGCLTARRPSAGEAADVQRGLAVARRSADTGIGQTVVVRHGVVTAVEAVEGTTAAIRRGTLLAGPGAVIVKTVARDHDYRFDTPAVGMETIAAAAEGRAAVVAVEAGRVLVVDRAATARAADAAEIALVSVDATG